MNSSPTTILAMLQDTKSAAVLVNSKDGILGFTREFSQLFRLDESQVSLPASVDVVRSHSGLHLRSRIGGSDAWIDALSRTGLRVDDDNDGNTLVLEDVQLEGVQESGSENAFQTNASQRSNSSQKVSVKTSPLDDDHHVVVFAPSASRPPRVPLLDSLRGLIYRCHADTNWSFEFVSQGSLDFCGYAPSEFLSGDVSFMRDVIFSQDQERALHNVRDAIAAQRPFELEYRVVLKDGSVRWAQERGQGIYDDKGTLVALEGLIVDTTKNQVLREELRYAHYLLRAVYDASPDALIIFGENGLILDANDGFTRLFGYTPDNLVDFDANHLIYRKADLRAIRKIAKEVLGGRELDVKFDLRHQDGTRIPVEIRLRRFENDVGNRFVVASIRDQREQQEAAAELVLSEQRYRQMFEGNHAVKLLIDPADGAILDANDAAVRFYGYDRPALVGMKIHEVNGRRNAELQQHLHQAIEGETHFEFRHRKKSGEIVDVEVHAGPLMITGKRVLYFIVHDISERRRLERELRASQRMEALGRLAGGIAHDFNNLMTVVSGSANLAHQELSEIPPGAPAHVHLTQIEGAAKRAAELTRQLLAFGRRQVLEPEVVSLHTVISAFDGMVDGLLSHSQITLTRHLEADAPMVQIDVAGLEQVLLNLVLNARDAVANNADDGRGKICICTRDVEVDERTAVSADIKSGRYVLLTVSDDGEGIAEHHLASIFDPFFSTKPSGTGLGLSSVYGLVKQSGGHVTVDSRLGHGSTFNIFLPRVKELPSFFPADLAPPTNPSPVETRDATVSPMKAGPVEAAVEAGPVDVTPTLDRQSPTPTHTAARPSATPTVVVVEDTDVVRRLIRLLLESDGWKVHAAANGQDALEMIQAQSLDVDLLVTDIRMPKMGGQKLAEELRRMDPSLPVLFLSGWLDDVPLQIADEVGMAFMQKPPDPEELFRMAHSLHLEGQRRRASVAEHTETPRTLTTTASALDQNISKATVFSKATDSESTEDETKGL